MKFFEDIVIIGSVLGADPTSGPDEVTAILGTDFAENRRSQQMWRDYGLVEFFWQRRSGDLPWQGTHFTVQVHRLTSAGTGVVNDNLRQRYGAIEPMPSFEALRTAVERHGLQLVELPGASPGCAEFWQPESQASVLVSTGEGDSGRVVKISVPLTADAVAVRRNRHEASSLSQALDHLVQVSEQDRATWLDRRQPDEPDRTNWWLHLLALIHNRIYSRPGQQRDWILLYWWALGQARDRRALSQVETAIQSSYFIAGLQRDGVDADVCNLLPPADDVVRTCLDLLPLGLGEAAERLEPNPLSVEAMRRSRQAKSLVTAAAPHLDNLDDEGLAVELRHWIALRTNLV